MSGFPEFTLPFKNKYIEQTCELNDLVCSTAYPRYKEAVIRTDYYAKILKEEFIKCIDYCTRKQCRTLEYLLRDINFYFDIYLIEFVNDGEIKNKHGINSMRTDFSSKKIIVDCNSFFKDNFYNESQELIQLFYELISHELVHRGQFIVFNMNKTAQHIDKLKRKKERLEFLSKTISREEYLKIEKKMYFSDSHEIMAYSNMALEELRFAGYTDTEILNIIKTMKNVGNDSYVLELYYEIFDKTDEAEYKVLKKFLKYIYEYIAGDRVHQIVL